MNVSWPLFGLLIGGLLFAVVLVLFWPLSRSRTKVNTPADRWPTSAIFRDDDRFWYGRDILYHNPDDPEVFVPKRYSGGWTVNVGHPLGKLIMIGVRTDPFHQECVRT